MTCRRAFDADLLAVVRGEDGDAAFRAHYPSCPECSAEVAVWGELDAMLRAGAPAVASHPEPEALLAFSDAPSTLASDARTTIERHLAACRVCADEVAAMRGFDAGQLGVAATGAAPASVGAESRARESHASWFGRFVWHPAVAYALVALLLVPLVRDQLSRVAVDRTTLEARREAPAPAPAPGAGLAAAPRQRPDARERDVEVLADADPASRAERPSAPAPMLAKRKVESEVAMREQADPGPERAPAAGAPVTGLAASAEGEAPLVVEIGPRASAIVSAPALTRTVRLRVVPPADLGPGPVDATVRERDGQRELAMRVSDRADAIAIEIPAGWLVAGAYVVTLAPANGGAAATFALTVRAPAASR